MGEERMKITLSDPRATARVPAAPLHCPRPYNEREGFANDILLLILFHLHQRDRPGLDGSVLLPDRCTALHSIQIQHYFTSSFDFLSNSTSELLPTLSSGNAASSGGNCAGLGRAI